MAAAVSLTSDLEELQTYATLWALMPYSVDTAVGTEQA